VNFDRLGVRPLIGDTWAQSKAFWFQVLVGHDPMRPTDPYRVYAEEVRAFHESDARVRIASAPARTSKSLSTSADRIPYLMPTEPLTDSLHWYVAPRYEQNKEFDYAWKWIVEGRERFRQGGVELSITRARNNPGHGEMEIVIEHGADRAGIVRRAVLKGLSIQRETDLQSEEVTTAILSEAAEHPERIWTKYLAARTWQAILPTTPKPHADWIRRLVELAGTNAGLGIAAFTYPAHANPNYDTDRYEQERRKACLRAESGRAEDDPMFAEQFLGHWVYYTGLVLPFRESRHVIDRARVDLDGTPKILGVDYGYEDPTVVGFWTILPNGILVRFDEIYERHLTTPQVVERTLSKLGPQVDDVDYVVGDPARPEVARLFRDAGLPVFDLDKRAMRDRAAGHRRLVDLLTAGPVLSDDGVPYPGLYVTSNCVETIREWKTLHYKESFTNEYGTTAIDGDDHAYDEARYVVMTRPAPSPAGRERDWVREHQRRVRERRLRASPRMASHGLRPGMG